MQKILLGFKNNNDMTKGKPLNNIVIFMIPMLIGNIAQQLYSTVDSIVVGKFVGDNALAAVGSVGSIVNLFVGISVGVGIMISQYFGAKDKENISKSIGTCVILTGISTIFLMILTPLISRPLLELLNTPDSIIEWSVEYLNIMLIGVGGMAYYNILCGVIRGLGDALTPLKYLLMATILNIILDLLFVAVFEWGVAGVAYATIIAQFISAIFCIRKIFNMHEFYELRKEHFKWSKMHTNTIIKLGLPSGLAQMVLSIAMVIIQPLTNSFGEMFIAANVVVMRVDGFAMMPNFSFGTAMSTFAGQNVGANRYDRVEEGTKKGTLTALLVSATITIIILIFGRNLVSIFTETEKLIDLCMRMLQLLSIGYLAMSVTQSLSGIMRGAGDTTTPMWISVVTTVIIRVPVAYIWAYFTNSETSVFGSLLVSWLCGALITIIMYKKGKWKTMAIK